MKNSLEAGKYPLFFIWSALYRRQLMEEHQIRFRKDISFSEDIMFNMDYLPQVKTMLRADKILYYYRVHNASAMRTPLSPGRIMMELRVQSELFRQHPCSLFANIYCSRLTNTADMGEKGDVKELIAHYQDNKDILAYVTERSAKFARLLFRLFGVYTGSAIFQIVDRVYLQLRYGSN